MTGRGQKAMPGDGLEDRILFLLGDPCREKIAVQVGLGCVMSRHLMEFPAFLVKAEPPAFAAGQEVADIHGDDGTHAGKTIDHHPNESPVPKASDGRDINAIKEVTSFVGG